MNTTKYRYSVKAIFIFFLILITYSLHSQDKSKRTEDSVKKVSDTIKLTNLDKETQKILITDSLRIADSIKMGALVTELGKLKTTDNLKKDQILEEINKLKQQDSLKKASIKSRIDSLKNTNSGYPVILRYDTLFVIYSGVGSFSALDRVNAITSKIKLIAEKSDFDSSKLSTRTTDITEIFYENIIVLGLSDNDAIWNNTDVNTLARNYINIINRSVIKYKSDTSFTSWLIRIAKVLVIIILLGAILKAVKWLFVKINVQIEGLKGTKLKGITIKSYQLMDHEKQTNAVLIAAKFIKWFLIIIFVYFALTLLFGVFPETRNIADTLLQYIISPAKNIARGIINFIPNLFTIIVIFIVTRYIVKFVKFIGCEVEKENLSFKGFYPDWAKPTTNIIVVLLYAFMFIAIFPYLPGSDSPVFRGVSVFLALLFSLGSTTAVANVVAGLVITYMRPFKIGDRVKIGEVTGDILEKGFLVTRVRTIKNEDITIPNASILAGHTVNYSTSSESLGLILYTSVTIGYDVPWKTVHELLINAAKETEGIDRTKTPFVLQTRLDDFYVSYQINAYTSLANKQALIYSELHKNIQDKFNEGGVEIMSPHYNALRDGNLTTIPANYLPNDYKTPDFNVKLNKDI